MKKSQYMPSQRGASFLGTLVFLTAFGVLATIGLKSLPVYLEFWSVQSALKSISKNSANQNDDEIRSDFEKHARIDNIEAFKSSDLVIDAGEVSVTYQKVVPLFSNISLLFDFKASGND